MCRVVSDPARTVIIDTCAGTGSTGAAAIKLGCLFIGSDRDGDVCNRIKARIDKAEKGIEDGVKSLKSTNENLTTAEALKKLHLSNRVQWHLELAKTIKRKIPVAIPAGMLLLLKCNRYTLPFFSFFGLIPGDLTETGIFSFGVISFFFLFDPRG
jgi:hypothetical protein